MKKSYYHIGGIFFGLILTASSINVQAQTRTISGTVTSSNQPLSGVIISQKGSDQVTTTNEKGTYRLEVTAENPILLFRHPEYSEQQITVSNQSVININLEQKVKAIEEVVLNAGYYNVKAKESTGSIAKVTAKDIENQPVNNVLSAVQGRMAGVSIIQNSGTAGAGYDVQIRGRNSLRSYATTGFDANSPLYIIDGVPIPSLKEYKSGLSGPVIPYGDTNPLNNINPADIESIEILKDADATAIYGSKGANGVVLITTKRGVKGKTQLQLNSSFGIGKLANLPEMMSTPQYLKMRQIAFENDGITSYPASQYDINGTWKQDKQTDWQKYFVGNTSEITDHQVAISGGSDNTRFSVSGGHHEETSVFHGDYRYKRNTISTSIEHLSQDKKLKVLFSGHYTQQSNALPPRDFNQVYASLAPNAPDLYTHDGNLNWENSTFQNPLAAASQKYSTESANLASTISLNYQLDGGINININGGYGSNTTDELKIYPKTFYNPAANIGSERSSLRKATMVNTNWVLEPQINFDKKWGVHKLSALIGTTFQNQNSDNMTLNATNFPSDELIYDVSSAATVSILDASQFIYRYQALYSRLNYSVLQKYFFNFSGRRDSSSRFGSSRRNANFGAVGALWIFSEEEFLKNIKFLSFAKLRTSYGITGSDQIGDYQFYDTYASTSGSYGGFTGIIPTRLYNKDFGWETTRKFEAAMEGSLWDNRLFFSAAWYRNTSTHQLIGIPLPATTGFATVQANLNATVLNSGTELLLQADILKKKNWKWSASLNMTLPVNKLVSFPDLERSSYANYFEIGKSTSIRKLYHYTGIDRDTGLYTFADTNGDGKISAQDKSVIKDLKQYWYGGLQNSVQYKNWSVDVLFQFIKQNQSNIFASEGYLGLLGNKSVAYLDYWTMENKDAKFQRPSAGYDLAATTASSLFLESDATVTNTFTLRLKNISLTYKIPQMNGRLATKIFVQGQNILSFSNYKGIDAEFNLPGYVSPLRVVSIGLNMTY